jgi:predicted O-methyltransferase YrrM
VTADTPLCLLALQHSTDKAPHTGHAYTPYYHELFKDRRESVRKVLEIGIDVGASLRMWRDYFPNAQIYALDCEQSKLVNDGRIHSFLCNQGDANSLLEASRWAGQDFDLILDDGSHDPAHQILTARMLVRLLAPDGVYVIEDVLRPGVIIPLIPYKCETVSFDVVRDPYSNVIVIRGEPL